MINHNHSNKTDTSSPAPELSIVVTIVSGAKHLEACLSALSAQDYYTPTTVEVIVPYDQRDEKIPLLKIKFSDVIFKPVALSVEGPPGLCHEHFDQLRSVGLHLTRGSIVAMLEDHEIPDKNWCKNMMAAHKSLDHAAIGGAVENDIDKPLNWATYFFDFGRYQNPVKLGPSPYLTDVNVAYKQAALAEIKDVWAHNFHEPGVHGALIERGETLWLSPDIITYQHRTDLSLSYVLKERYVWGRYFSGKRVEKANLATRSFFCLASFAVPAIILMKRFRDVLRKKRHVKTFLKVLPVTLVLIVSWSIGEFVGYFTGRPSSLE